MQESRWDLDKLAQEIYRASPPLTDLQLSNLKVGRFFGNIILHRGMDFETFQNIRRTATGVDDTLGHIRVHLSQVRCCEALFVWLEGLFLGSFIFFNFIFFLFQVRAYISYLGRIASSANTSKTMQINMEKKCADLEGQLSWKDKASD